LEDIGIRPGGIKGGKRAEELFIGRENEREEKKKERRKGNICSRPILNTSPRLL